MTSWFGTLDLTDVTIFVHDWGSLIGLEIVAEHGARFARVVVANGFLPTADRVAPPAFRIWRAFAKYTPWLNAGRLVGVGTVTKVPPRCGRATTRRSPTSDIRPARLRFRNWYRLRRR